VRGEEEKHVTGAKGEEDQITREGPLAKAPTKPGSTSGEAKWFKPVNQ